MMVDDGSMGANASTKKRKKKRQHQQKQLQLQGQSYVVNKEVDDTLLNDFLDVMEELGFQCVKKDRQNKMFIVLEFQKTGKRPSKDACFTAKPCIYKRR